MDSPKNESAELSLPPSQGSTAARPASLSPELRHELIARLPRLAYSRGVDAPALQVRGDLSQVLELDAEAFLRPLEQLLDQRRPR